MYIYMMADLLGEAAGNDAFYQHAIGGGRPCVPARDVTRIDPGMLLCLTRPL